MRPQLGRHALAGRDLRYSLLTVLAEAGRPLSISDLLRALEARGLVVAGRDPRKTIGDVLRYERSLGRVRRVARGTYVAGYRPPTTVRRHRQRLHDLVEAARRRRAGPC